MNEQWRSFARTMYRDRFGYESVVDNRELDGLFRLHNDLSALLVAMRDYFQPTYEIPFVLPPVRAGMVFAFDRLSAVAYHFNLKGAALKAKLAELERKEEQQNSVALGCPYDYRNVSEASHSWSGRGGYLD